MSRTLPGLSPRIEHRLLAWEAIHRHLAGEAALRVRPTITLSRQFGCEGYPVAEQVSALLAEATGEPWAVHDRQLLEAVARQEGIPLEVLRHLGETARSLERLGVRPLSYLRHQEAFRAVAERLLQVAAVGNAVIVGRGGAALCRGQPNCFHFRLTAPFAWRVERTARRLDLPEAEARALVEANHSLRMQFLQEQLQLDPADPRLFDAVFDNARAGAAAIAAAIAAHVQAAWPDRMARIGAGQVGA